MPEKILCIDDEPNILAGYQRTLRKTIQADVAVGGAEGLHAIAANGPYAVVISDMNMPGMDGIKLFSRIKEICPDTVRIMITGVNDLGTAIAAVNEGNIFRFLTKPCDPENLIKSVEAGIRQYQLLTAEHILLEKTLAGSIAVLTEILSLVDSEAFGRADALRSDIRTLAQQLKLGDIWEMELGAMLAQIGNVTIPPVTLLKAKAARPLSDAEKDMLLRVPEIGSRLIANIPRMTMVSRIILYVNKHFNGEGFPKDAIAGADIPVGSRVLRILFDMSELERQGTPRSQALAQLKKASGIYDHGLLDGAISCFCQPKVQMTAQGRATKSIAFSELRSGQILRSDIETSEGKVLVAAGHAISETLIERLSNFARITAIKEPILVELPPATAQSSV